MNFNLYVAECIQNTDVCKEISGFAMEGLRILYGISESESQKEQAAELLKKAVSAKWSAGSTIMDSPAVGRACFFLYEQMGEAHSKETMEACMEQLRSCPRTKEGIFRGEGMDESPMPWTWRFDAYPFYMEYETKYHNKADYADIVKQLLRLAPEDGEWTSDTAWYLMTVIMVMDRMSREIFEHYKSLEEVFKATIRNILSPGWKWDFEQKESAMMGCSILKACNMGVLNSEKYAEIGLFMTDGLINGSFDLKDSELAGLAMMAYAWRLTLNNL